MKLFEKIIQFRLSWWATNNDIIPNFQYGFTQNKSTTDAVLDLVTYTQAHLFDGDLVGVIFLDIKGAFDNVDPFILTNLLINLKCNKKFALLFYNLIKLRIVSAYVDGKFISRGYMIKGLPQGSGLSPFLFITFISCIRSFINENIKLILFADDIALCFASKIFFLFEFCFEVL